jgi:hypothetical protein
LKLDWIKWAELLFSLHHLSYQLEYASLRRHCTVRSAALEYFYKGKESTWVEALHIFRINAIRIS